MARIRVNTEDLKNKAKDFDSAAEAFKRAGDDILAAAMAMPSYDGQLSGPARKMGYEFQKQARELSTALAGDAESLRKSAQAFEEVDNQTVKLIEENTILLSASLLPGGPGGEDGGPIKKVGNFDLLGYYDYGDSVIFWKNGESMSIIVTDENRELIKRYKMAIEEFCKNLADLLNTLRDLILRNLGIAQVALIIAVLVALAVISPQIMLFLIGELGISAELIGRVMENAQELAAHYGAEYSDEIAEKLGALLDPLDPTKYLEDINNIAKYGQATAESYYEAEQVWNTLSPPKSVDSSEPKMIPVPTPPSPTSTPTPSR